MINYDCPTPYQFLLGTVQQLALKTDFRFRVLVTVSIPLRYGTTHVGRTLIVLNFTVSIPLRYGTTLDY